MSKAKNATFLFHRDFMEYHQDRFDDFSLMVFKDDKLVGILPANIQGHTVYSHQGLTYGGVIVSNSVSFLDVKDTFKALLVFLETKKVSKLELKQIPSIYCSLPSDELSYILFKMHATLERRDVLSVVDNSNKLEIVSSNRKRGLKKALKHQLEVREVNEFGLFWNSILIPNLKQIHGVSPVHSLEEITTLHNKFPRNIRQFNVYHKDDIVAGVTVFETQKVAHAQYISANKNRQEYGSLDFLFFELINSVYKTKQFFDFGISNENQGQQINQGLLSWKESFGARTITQSFYSVETKNHVLLNDLMI